MMFYWLLVFLFFASNANAATYWISLSGNDGNQHCVNSAFPPPTTSTSRTIAQGVGCLSSNDTLYLLNGTYNEFIDTSLYVIPSGTGNPSDPNGGYTKIAGAPGARPTLRPTADQSRVVGVYDPGRIGGRTDTYIWLDNLIIDATFQQGDTAAHAISIGQDHWKLTNFEAFGAGNTDYPGNGVSAGGVGGIASNCNVHDNGKTIHDPYRTGGYAFYVHEPGWLIENCQLHHNGGYAIHLYGQSGHRMDGAIVRNNEIYANSQSALTLSAGILVSTGSNLAIYNNIIRDDLQSGIQIFSECSNCLIYNNTIVRNAKAGILFDAGGITGEIKNNILWNNNTGGGSFNNFEGATTGFTLSNNLCNGTGGTNNCDKTGNPLFVDPASNNFQLSAGSAAIDQGLNLGFPYNTDKNGVPRTIPWDLGAYEAGGGGGGMTVVITSPATNPYSTSSATLTPNLAGNVTNGGTLSSVTWNCNRCGSGTATLAGANWSVPSITLKPGDNIITVTASGSNGGASATLTATYAPTFPGQALVGAWGFEENTGATTADSSGNKNNGTISGATWVPNGGKFGNALSFNGTSNVVTIQDANSLDFTQSFTFSAWVLPTTIDSAAFRAVVVKNYVQFLYATNDGRYCAGGVVWGGLFTNGGANPGDLKIVCSAPMGPLQTGIWTHLAITYDNANFKLYKDGNLVTTASTGTGYMEPSTGPLATLMIGASKDGDNFAGRIDEVRVYNWAIPLDTGIGAGAPCRYTDYTTAVAGVSGNQNLATIRDDMNCAVIPTPVAPPFPVKIPASATGLKVGSASSLKFGSK